MADKRTGFLGRRNIAISPSPFLSAQELRSQTWPDGQNFLSLSVRGVPRRGNLEHEVSVNEPCKRVSVHVHFLSPSRSLRRRRRRAERTTPEQGREAPRRAVACTEVRIKHTYTDARVPTYVQRRRSAVVYLEPGKFTYIRGARGVLPAATRREKIKEGHYARLEREQVAQGE